MTRIEKNQLIDELSQMLLERNVVYLTDASGLDAEQTTLLRRESSKKGHHRSGGEKHVIAESDGAR